ncbi:unnamed protein product [Vitrella brassicaformis CCMP3155]|uniref:THUMP domain-containing protein n=1 Tax=Vitrella brassicaformis (strain CCMP3155) TaxID=1169540 RepID=A0A0G4E8L9_VITBC|nr:unnamed protein product [Vitrella brassicaformis CCMP3155]|eukprot:CEL92165.1 unnamed protein product [Vitrella brassicaformis CCMP3155]
MREFFVPCAAGLETIVEMEMRRITEQLAGGRDALDGGSVVTKQSKRGVTLWVSKDIPAAVQLPYWLTVCLRTGQRVLERIDGPVELRERDDLWSWVNAIDWRPYMSVQDTLSVQVTLGNDVPSDLRHTHFTALTVKDAIVKQFLTRDKSARPSVDFVDPDLPLFVYLHQGRGTLYRAWSGAGSLHKRGYRKKMPKAALRETMAAGMLYVSQWDPQSRQVLLDPMCGSGTIPIEAALMATRRMPGVVRLETFLADMNVEPYRTKGTRVAPDAESRAVSLLTHLHRTYDAPPRPSLGEDCRHDNYGDDLDGGLYDSDGDSVINGMMSPVVRPFPFCRWPDFDEPVWRSVLRKCVEGERDIAAEGAEAPVIIYGSDRQEGAIAMARDAARRAGVSEHVQLSHNDIAHLQLPHRHKPDVIVSNPPWDIRLNSDAGAAWEAMRAFVCERAGGGRAWLLCGGDARDELFGAMRMRAAKKRRIVQGGVEMSLRAFDIWDLHRDR